MDNLFLEGFDLLEMVEMNQILNNIIPESAITENELLIELYQTQTEIMEQNRMVMEQLHYEYVNEGAADVFKKIGHAIGEMINKLIGLFKKVINFLFHKNKDEDKKLEENADKAAKTVESDAKECKKKVQLLLTTNSKDQNFTFRDAEEEPSKPIYGTDNRSGQLSLEDKYGKILEEIKEIETKRNYDIVYAYLTDKSFTVTKYYNALSNIANEPILLNTFKIIEIYFDILNKKEYEKLEYINSNEIEDILNKYSRGHERYAALLSKIGYENISLRTLFTDCNAPALYNKYELHAYEADEDGHLMWLNRYLKNYPRDKKIFENMPQNRDKMMQFVNSELKKIENFDKKYSNLHIDAVDDDKDTYGAINSLINYMMKTIHISVQMLATFYKYILSDMVNCEKLYEIHKRNLKQLCRDKKRLNELKSNFGKQKF